MIEVDTRQVIDIEELAKVILADPADLQTWLGDRGSFGPHTQARLVRPQHLKHRAAVACVGRSILNRGLCRTG